MRWWDTGVSAGNAYHGGSFTNTLGSNDTLIGVGREERDKLDGKIAAKVARRYDQSPRGERLKTLQRSEMGRYGGWLELKAHQMQTTRRYNMSCLGRYEKLFKQGGPENFVLAKAGAGYTTRDGKQWPWPLGWRGYASDTTPRSFPEAFGMQNSNSIGSNLDHALPGDIIMYKANGVNRVYYVTDIGFPVNKNRASAIFDFGAGKFREGGPGGPLMIPDRIFVVGWDQGKFPTSTGMSVSWGMGVERTIYKYKVPDYFQKQICANTMSALTDAPVYNGPQKTDCSGFNDNLNCVASSCQPSCEDVDYSACVLPASGNAPGWEQAVIYRPNIDVRQCKGANIEGGPTGSNFDLDETYKWVLGLSGVPNIRGDVIYQGLTQQVDSDLWSFCTNAGYDPPPHFARDYKGPQTGALTDNTLCGPKWGECSALSTKSRFFPRGWGVHEDPKK